jgi:catechol 2,3-dioxygenase-like lactoylglutathione lyase family enzyme
VGGGTMIKKLNNVTIPVSSLKEIVEFYEKVLGLKKQFECPSYVIFDCGGVELAFEPGVQG